MFASKVKNDLGNKVIYTKSHQVSKPKLSKMYFLLRKFKRTHLMIKTLSKVEIHYLI